jgi:hypothetical protein
LQTDARVAVPLDDRPVNALPPGAELPKAQTVRLGDVFLLGPLMIWGGIQLRDQYPYRGGWLAVAGAATIFYNGYNYLRLREQGYE